MKKYLLTGLSCLGIGLGSLIILTLILTLFNYFNFITGTFFDVMKLLIPLSSLFIAGWCFGHHSKQKGWLEGLKLGLIFIFLFTISQWLLIKEPFQFGNLIYDLILLIVTIFGSVIGINTQKEK